MPKYDVTIKVTFDSGNVALHSDIEKQLEEGLREEMRTLPDVVAEIASAEVNSFVWGRMYWEEKDDA